MKTPALHYKIGAKLIYFIGMGKFIADKKRE